MNNTHPDCISHTFTGELPFFVPSNIDRMTIIHLNLGNRSKNTFGRHTPNTILQSIEIHEVVDESH